MKKALALILAVIFVFVLFAGCDKNDGGTTPGDTTEVIAATDTPETPAPTATPDNSPYNFAAGKVETNDKGYPTAPYEYELPISTTDEVLTYWTSSLTPQYIPEDGYGSMPFATGMNELTGVNIEYQMIAFGEMATNFSTLMAADDLPDMMNWATSWYPGSYHQAVDDGFFINIYDYKDYCPNYIYQATFDPADLKTFETVFYESDFIIAFYNMGTENYCPTGKVIRGDYLEKVGLTNEDLVTWDDWMNALSLIKSQVEKCVYPWPLTNFIDGNWTSPSFDTRTSVSATALPATYIKDGKVCFGDMNDGDLAYMQKMNEFFNAGIIDPNWASYNNSFAFSEKTLAGETALMDMAESEPAMANANNSDPNCNWVPVRKPLLTENQVIHLGSDVTRVGYGNTEISAKCENIELAVSWCDYWYSPSGSFYVSYGPEGVLWEYDSEGNVMSTEFAVTHESGIGWIYMLYADDNIIEHGLEDSKRKSTYVGGEKQLEVRAFWADYAYDGTMEYPTGARLNDEESAFVKSLSTDIQTYIGENFSLFLDGTKPFSEWDAYVEGLYNLQMQSIIDTYQTAYDRYLAAKA